MTISALTIKERQEKISLLRSLEVFQGWDIIRSAILDDIEILKERRSVLSDGQTDQELIAYARRMQDLNRDITGLEGLVSLPDRLCRELEQETNSMEVNLDPYQR